MRTHINTSQAEGRGFESRFPLLSSVALAKEDQMIIRELQNLWLSFFIPGGINNFTPFK